MKGTLLGTLGFDEQQEAQLRESQEIPLRGMQEVSAVLLRPKTYIA